MSGTNPFRRKEAPGPSQPRSTALETGAEALHQAGIRFPPIDTGVQKSTKSKTVRIISPHYSRNRDDYGISGIISPPPQRSGSSPRLDADSPSPTEEPSPIDPFSAQSDEGTSQDDDEDLRRNTIANTAPAMPQNPINIRLPLKLPKKAPALQFGGDSSTIENHKETDHEASVAATGRPIYDVDDFKRLLLTGEKPKTEKNMAAAPPLPVDGSQKGDSNRNTSPSSISHQSFFNPQAEAQPESAKTSKDGSPPEHESHGVIQPPSATSIARSRPSVPPSRHGKLVKSSMPQTVSFESFSSSPPDRNLTFPQPPEPSSATSPDSTTHLNKPLPAPPVSEFPTMGETLSVTSATPVVDIETGSALSHLSAPAAPKPSPPPLPTARRHGQNRSRSSTNDSNRSASLSEDLSQNTHPSSSSSSIVTSKPPPLPPPRRAATAPGLENTGPVSNVELNSSSMESPHFKPRPPAPPSRTPSATSIRRSSRISTASGSSAAVTVPPPPAPRRRGSSQSQSSFTPSRLSGEYRISSYERPRADSGASSTQQPAMDERSIGGKDLVADLTALQNEVDELRGKFGR